MVKVKICGITNLIDALKAQEFGADFLGFVFFDKSPRRLAAAEANLIIRELPKGSVKVGLFLDQDIQFVKDTAEKCRLDILQLHGNENPGYVARLKKHFTIIKAFRIKDASSIAGVNDYKDVDYYLFDTYVKGMPGGTGRSFNWDILKDGAFKRPVFLAGGLDPKNVAEAVGRVNPYAVDVASGVEEAPGRKNHNLLKEFIENAKKA